MTVFEILVELGNLILFILLVLSLLLCLLLLLLNKCSILLLEHLDPAFSLDLLLNILMLLKLTSCLAFLVFTCERSDLAKKSMGSLGFSRYV